MSTRMRLQWAMQVEAEPGPDWVIPEHVQSVISEQMRLMSEMGCEVSKEIRMEMDESAARPTLVLFIEMSMPADWTSADSQALIAGLGPDL